MSPMSASSSLAQAIPAGELRTGADSLSEALVRAGLRRPGSPPLILERGWPLPKIPLLLRCSEPGIEAGDDAWWSFYFLGSGKIPFVCRSAVQNGQATYLSELNAIAHRFPSDLQLDHLDETLSRRTALPLLSRALAEEKGVWHSVKGRILGYKPSRRLTVKFRLTRKDGSGRTLYAKLLPAGVDDEAIQVQRQVESVLGDIREPWLAVPRLVGRVPSWDALLWKRVPDPPLFAILGTSDGHEAVAAAACGLAQLHSSGAPWQRTHDRRRELETVRQWIEAASVFGSPHSELVGRSFDRLEEVSSRLGDGAPAPSHRDFYDKQVLVGNGGCTLLDLEVACLAEPELDAGNFLAHLLLRSMQGRIPSASALCERFVDRYQMNSRRLEPSRLRWYLASSLLRLACVYSMRQEWSGLEAGLLQACHEALEGEIRLQRSS